ncbi:MobH family relaxase [Pseudomonas quasicaspiana]|uniref:MobH family relaxase n=1 Tax=Pseudomonas quasicaspiana TaxID=2829821 RepID=UPI001E430652|nr:MobH family relaxase [Pseudomonas quasicaspiana]MCD5973162.1 TraI domain-containing protein [Pseudomonas quasicaspiana]
MLSLFQRKRASVAAAASPGPTTDLPKGLTRPETAASLLATPRRQKLLEHIWQRTSLSRQQFDTLYRTPLERYAALVQQFPASESHHHAYHGGMLDHGLEIVAYALKLRQSYLLPAGATPEDQAAQAEAWTAATAYAALLHDIGKIAVDLHVEQADGSVWHPWHGPLKQPYRFRYREDREYRLHSAATSLLYHQVIDRFILDWLSGFPSLWAALLYIMAGQYEHAGVLGELVIKADRASVAQELGGDPAKAMAAPKHALQRKLLDGLRYLLKEELKLNQPQASDGWLTHDALWLVSKTVSDKLRAHLLSQGIDGIPANNSAVFNVLQEHSMLQPAPDGKAIWRATVTSSSGWSHAFTLLRLSPALIWEAGERPAAYAGTVLAETGQGAEATGESAPDLLDSSMQDTAEDRANPPLESKPSLSTQPVARNAPDMMDELLAMIGEPDQPKADDQGNSSVQPTPEAPAKPHQVSESVLANKNPMSTSTQPSRDESNSISTQMSADHFVTWLQQAIASRRLVINDAKALVHIVADAVYLVSPGVFQRYAQEHPQIADYAKREEMTDWQWAQKRFEKLHLHRKQANGLNIWTCEVTGPRKSRRLHGYLLERWQGVFGELPPNNPYLKLREVSSDATIEADDPPRVWHN